MKLNDLIHAMNIMRQRLGWDKTDDLASLITYLNEEVTELTKEANATTIDYQALKSEIADVMIVMLALIDDLEVDLEKELQHKIAMTIKKYEQT